MERETGRRKSATERREGKKGMYKYKDREREREHTHTRTHNINVSWAKMLTIQAE